MTEPTLFRRIGCDLGSGTCPVVGGDLLCDISGIVADTINQTGLGIMHPRKSNKIQAQIIRDAALLDGISIGVMDRQLDE